METLLDLTHLFGQRGALIARSEKMRQSLETIQQLAGRNGPPNELDALNEIESVAKAALHDT